jgi:peptide/nickel transport system substrate-binding protein
MARCAAGRWIRLLGVALAMVLVAAACGSSGSGKGAANGALKPVRVAIAPFTTVDPFGNASGVLHRLGIEETLTVAKPSYVGIEPGMLASATHTSPLMWTFTLRPGIRFQDGKVVDAAAVVACLRLDGAKAFSPDDVSAGTLAVSGPLSFTITTKRPVGDLPAELANFENYNIFDVAAYQAAGQDLASLVHRGIYTGPFEPVSLGPTGMVLKANPDYWGGKVALPGVQVLFISDPQAEIAAVENGEADIAIEPPESAAKALQGDPRAFYVTDHYAWVGSWAMLDQMPGSVLADPVVRQALSKAIDYTALVAGLQPEGVVAATGLFPSYAPYAVADQVYDPAQAKALLDGDGWHVGPGGIRTKGGQPLSFTYLWSASQDPVNGDLGLVLQQQLKAVGIDMKIRQVEEAFTVPSQPSQWGMTVVALNMEGYGNPYANMEAFLASGQGGNIGGIHDPTLDALITRFDAASSPAQQDQVLRQIQGEVAKGAYGIMLSYHTDAFVVSPAYRHFQPGPGFQEITASLRPSG